MTTAKTFDGCAKLQAPRGAAVGDELVACEVATERPSPAAVRALASAAGRPKAADIVDLPSWCTDNAFTGWWFIRTAGCEITGRRLTVTNINTGAVIGTMDYLQLVYVYTSTSIQTFAQQIELYPYSIEGAAAGATAQGSATCSGACTNPRSDFPSQLLRLNTDAEGESYFDTTTVAAGAVGFTAPTWTRTITNPAWTVQPLPVSITPPWQIRCDNNTSGNAAVGCVFPQYEPALIVSLTGPYPNFARHLSDAQASGLPGAYPNGTPLTRMVDAGLSNRNGATACPDASAGGYPRPPGYSCDEYPFRSTREGAYTISPDPAPRAPGRTFPWCQISALGSGSGSFGWSACMIPVGENSGGGALLNGFTGIYRTERMLDGDKFFVWIVP
ncbi:hypothetical protein ACWEIJ_13190 [Lentzea sp. NPDC004789]